MVVADKIGWGKYGPYEGPYFGGSIRYTLPVNPTEDDRRLRVLTATEGGTYDAVNMYDQCIISTGLIQWCEATYFLTSKLLHAVCEAGSSSAVLSALQPALTACSASYKQNPAGQWRFFDAAGEVTTLAKQQALFLGCDGKQGSWTPESTSRAKLWAACMANIWSDKGAQAAHATYTAKRLMGFVMTESQKILWDGSPDSELQGAMRAAFISFAGNNPNIANTHLVKASKELKSTKWSTDWCIGVLREMTFGPSIAIYSTRYDKIRPYLEQLWTGVALPKTADDLKKWIEPDLTPVPNIVPETPPEPVIVHVDPITPVPPEQIRTIPFPAPKPDPESPSVLGFLLKLLMSLFGKK